MAFKARWPALISLVSAALFILQGCAANKAATAPSVAPDGFPVSVTKVMSKAVPVEIQAVGNVEAYSTISVRAQITGLMTEVLFHEGDFVKKGDHLFTIDPRAFQAQLEQAEANLKRDEALLIKCFDSTTDGRARFAPHTAFDDPTAPPDMLPRESIEIRSLVFHRA